MICLHSMSLILICIGCDFDKWKILNYDENKSNKCILLYAIFFKNKVSSGKELNYGLVWFMNDWLSILII